MKNRASSAKNRRSLPNKMPYQNHLLPVSERVSDLISRMTLREKCSQLIHEATEIEHLGIARYNWWNECLHGVARAGRATVFPQAIGMAASFDAPLLRQAADAISSEARAKHHQAVREGFRGIYFGLNFWSPNINLYRDPRWGRGQETYGEDPYLTSRMGVAFVKGLQGDDPRYMKVAAAPKHFAVHSGPEPSRHRDDIRVSARDLHETYLPHFKAVVQEAKAAAVMSAYNRVNGESATAHSVLLKRILRDEWGFKGHVVSDCGAVSDIHYNHKIASSLEEAAALALKNGCDLFCDGLYPALVSAAEKGLVDEATIDAALARVLTTRFRLGMFDPPAAVPFTLIKPEAVDCSVHRALARKMARESIVLLRNEGGLLPLDKKKHHTIAVVGPHGSSIAGLKGNYHGTTTGFVTVLEGVIRKVSVGTRIIESRSCEMVGEINNRLGELTCAHIPEADIFIACLGFSPELEGEEQPTIDIDGFKGGDKRYLDLPEIQKKVLEALIASGKPVILVLFGGSPMTIGGYLDKVPAVLMAWYPGEEGGNAVADVLFGDYNPAGRTPITWPLSLDQLPPFEEYAMKGRTYRFMEAAPLFRFGYGLSYTRFRYGNLRVKRMERGSAPISVTCDVTNVGSRDGDEVAQLYVSDVKASVPVPRVHLEGFQRIRLAKGARKKLSFTLTAAQLSAYDDNGRPFLEPGEFTISVGGGQPDDPASGAVSARVLL